MYMDFSDTSKEQDSDHTVVVHPKDKELLCLLRKVPATPSLIPIPRCNGCKQEAQNPLSSRPLL
jgi:hypothetical protein